MEAFLAYLVVQRKVSVATHRQAFSALLFLYQKVFGVALPWMDDLARPVPKKRIPVVMTRPEVQAVLGHLEGQHKVLASLLYGCGLRLMEGLRLRVKDVDFDRHVIIVRDGQGQQGSRRDAAALAGSGVAPEDAGGAPCSITCLKNGCSASCKKRWCRRDLPNLFQCTRRAIRCDPTTASRHRHPHRARAAGAFGCVHHHDLHTRFEGGGGWHGQPAGCAGCFWAFAYFVTA